MLMTPYVVTPCVMIWTALAKNTCNSELGALGTAFSSEERH
jgi:hypothetical protein